MSHVAPVNTVPTDSAGSLTPVPLVTVLFDVASLDRTEAFYSKHLGFKNAATLRAGLPYETRALMSDRYPGVALYARQTYQRPVQGTVIGSVQQIGLRDPALVDRIPALEGQVTWIASPPHAAEGQTAPVSLADVKRVSFLDPDGYIVELFR